MRAATVGLIALALLGSGCAIKNVQLTRPPVGALLPHIHDQARLIVVRPSMVGMIVPFTIHVNHVDVGTLHSHDYVEVLVPPGETLIETRGETDCFMTFPAEAGHEYYVQATPKMGWIYARVQLELLEPTKGAEAMAECENQTQPGIRIPTLAAQ